MATLGEKVQKLRTSAGLSQEELAERLQVSRQAVSKWELGRATPPVRYVVQLIGLFGVTTDDLLLDEGQRETSRAAEPDGDSPPPASSLPPSGGVVFLRCWRTR